MHFGVQLVLHFWLHSVLDLVLGCVKCTSGSGWLADAGMLRCPRPRPLERAGLGRVLPAHLAGRGVRSADDGDRYPHRSGRFRW